MVIKAFMRLKDTLEEIYLILLRGSRALRHLLIYLVRIDKRFL